MTERQTPRTAWIGGSYKAACGHVLPPPKATSTKPPKDTSMLLRSRALKHIEENPGVATDAIAQALGVNMTNMQWTLQKMRRSGKVHRVRRSIPRLGGVGAHPQNSWYPGPDTGVLR